MKTSRLILFVIAAAALASAGCANNPLARKKPTPQPPVAVAQSQPSTPPSVQPTAPANIPPITIPAGQTFGFTPDQRPVKVKFTTMMTLLNPTPTQESSGCQLPIINHRRQNVVFLIRGLLAPINARGGRYGFVALSPGEIYYMPDYGYGERLDIYALVLDDDGNRIGYVKQTVHWPTDGDPNHRMPEWHLVEAVGNQPDPMTPLPYQADDGSIHLGSTAPAPTASIQQQSGPNADPQPAAPVIPTLLQRPTPGKKIDFF